MKLRVLSTKRLRPNQKNFLLNAGFAVVEADFIKICRLEPDLDRIGHSLIFTSGNAVRSFIEHPGHIDLLEKECFCVGEKTRALLVSAGFTVVASAGTAAELLPKIKVYSNRTFTFFSGNLRLDTLPVSLKMAGIKFNEIRAYITKPSPIEVGGNFDAILFYSPSGVDSFLSSNKIGNATCICIGHTTAGRLKNSGAEVIVAAKPSIENVIIRCIKWFADPNNKQQ